jgi:3',5'-cyclic-nucleotide phosphodiesterase
MTVQSFPLSHVNPYESTAFLIKNANDYVLYLGDTGPDALEKSNNLKDLWTAIAPFIQSQQLKGIFIEVSFPNEQPDQFLFGHLTPKYLMDELHALEKLAREKSLGGFKIIVTHLKPSAKNIKLIKEQLKNQNDLGVKFIFPEQGKGFEL